MRIPSAADCLVYAEAIFRSKPAFLPALQELLRLQACSRCCLRFAGVREDIYSTPAPLTEHLHSAVEQIANSRGPPHTATGPQALAANTCQTINCGETSAGQSADGFPFYTTPQALPAIDTSSGYLINPQHSQKSSTRDDSCELLAADASGQQEGLLTQKKIGPTDVGSGKPSTHSKPVCRVCLGILQSLDGPLEPVPADVLPQLSERDGGGALWSPAQSGDAVSIAKHIKALDFACSGFAIELSVPASTQLRQLATWYHLRSLPETAELFPGESFRDDVVDLKESLRFRNSIAGPVAEALCKPLSPQDGDLRVTANYIHPASASESDFLFGKPFNGRSQRKRRKRTVMDVDSKRAYNTQWPGLGRSSSEAVVTAAGRWTVPKFRQECAVPPLQATRGIHLMIAARRLPLYIGGMYKKLERDVSQSPWTIDGKKKGRTSVQEEIEKVLLPGLRCDGCKFITAGREDMDVRMLGKGRPFVMEIQNQRAEMPDSVFFARVEDALRKSGVGVEVRCLQPVPKDKLQAIKEGEQSKQKSYEAICKLPCLVTQGIIDRINSCKDLLLHQNTPQRVAHRRALLVRERFVYHMHCQPIEGDGTLLKLNLRTQAGTYIKEFVHGDEGRTEPNLGSFLKCAAPAEILQLDVLEIHMDFL